MILQIKQLKWPTSQATIFDKDSIDSGKRRVTGKKECPVLEKPRHRKSLNSDQWGALEKEKAPNTLIFTLNTQVQQI